MRGEPIATCTVSNPHAPAEMVLRHLGSVLKLCAQIANEESLGQRTRAWNILLNGKSSLITAIDASPTDEHGRIISATTAAKR